MSNSIQDIKLQAAIKEFAAIAHQPLYKEVIETWLADYKELREEMIAEFDLPPLEMIHGRIRCEFYEIHRLFTNLMECYCNEVICASTMSEYYAILKENKDVHDNVPLQQWVRKNEQIDTNYSIIERLYYNDDVNYVNDIYGVKYFVSGDQFKKIVEFRKVFEHLFWEEKILPDRIAQIDEEQRQAEIKWLEEKEQRKIDDYDMLCDECKPLGYCKNHPPKP